MKFEEEQRKQKEELERAQKLEEEAAARYRECEMKADKALDDMGDDGLFTKLGNGLTSKVLGANLFGKSRESKEAQYQAAKENQKEALQLRIKRGE